MPEFAEKEVAQKAQKAAQEVEKAAVFAKKLVPHISPQTRASNELKRAIQISNTLLIQSKKIQEALERLSKPAKPEILVM